MAVCMKIMNMFYQVLVNEADISDDESVVDLVVFYDASSGAYVAVAYFRFELKNGAVLVAIVMAKTKLQ